MCKTITGVALFLMFCIITVGKHIEEIPAHIADDRTTNICREKQTLIDADEIVGFEFVETVTGEHLKLACHYCDESDDYLPKMWYKQNRLNNSSLTEVDLGTKDILSENRVYMTPDHTLIIREVSKEDAGLYYCRQMDLKDEEFTFRYIVDVVIRKNKVTVGLSSEWKLSEENSYREATLDFSTSNRSDYVQLRNMGFKMRVISEWQPWSQCDGCRKIKTRRTVCRLIPDFMSAFEQINSSSDVTNISVEVNKENMYLLKSQQFSCFSLELESNFPNISYDLQQLSVFMIEESCFGPCKFQFKSSFLPRYKNILILKEGDHFTLICPESNGLNEVTWRIDGVLMEPFTKSENILLDAFNNLIILYATTDEAANYTCFVGEVRMQEIIVIVKSDSVVASSEFSRYLIYLGFLLFLNFLLYMSGVMMTYKRRHTFEKVDFTMYEEDSFEYEVKGVFGSSEDMNY